MSCDNIRNHMRGTKRYLESQNADFDSDDLVDDLDDLSEEYTGNRYGGGDGTGWNTRLHNIADEVMDEDE